MTTVKSIRKRLVGFSVLFTVSTFLTLWFTIKAIPEGAFPIGAITAILLFFLIRQYVHLHDAKLIYDNRIIAVPSAIITRERKQQKITANETIISTFGILLGDELFKWGCDGRNGVKLNAIKIDRIHIRFSFGNESEAMCAELLHGFDEGQAVSEVKRRLWHETGVQAEVSDW